MILNIIYKVKVFDFWPKWRKLFWLKMRDLDNVSCFIRIRTLKIRHLQMMFNMLQLNQTSTRGGLI